MVRTVGNRTYRKNIRRELRRARRRLVSFYGIILLGVMMLTGLMSVGPDMRRAERAFFEQQNLFDLRVVSTLGLSEADVEAIAAAEGVGAVMPVYSVDCTAVLSGGDGMTVRVQEMPADPGAETPENMNRLTLLEGRMPEGPDECVVTSVGTAETPDIGTTLTLEGVEGSLSSVTLTVVGLVRDPLHFSIDNDSSTAGSGKLDLAAFVPAGSFTVEYYASCYLKVEGTDALTYGTDAYDDAVEAVSERLEELSGPRSALRREELIDDARQALEEAKAEFARQEAEANARFAEAEAQLEDAARQLEEALAELEAGEAEYSDGQAELARQKSALPGTMAGGAEEIVDGQARILDFEDQLQQIKLLVSLKQVADPMLDYAEALLANARQALDEAEPDDEEYTELRELLAQAQELYDTTYAQLEGYQAQLDEGKAQMYQQGLISAPDLSNEQLVTEAEAALRQMKLDLLEGQLALNTGTATAWAAFEEAENQLSAARSQLNSGWIEYNEGAAGLEAARAEFADQKQEAERELADARRQLQDAEEQVSKIEAGEWYLLDRSTVTSIVTFEQNADRMEAIGRVFPAFFFLVAALVATTTMTRMVDENRLQMGTLKALGYSDWAIASKYLLYGLTTSLLGCVVGMMLGFAVLPTVVWNAYATVYSLPAFRPAFYPGLAAAGLLVSMAVVGLTTLAACRACLKEKTAALLLPRAPAAGKRILLERMHFIWDRMTFSQKTTARNLFRYKKRFFMTVLGVAGCTALLLIGFGLRDSIGDLLDKQYGELNHGDLTVSLSGEEALTTEGGLGDLLDSNSQIKHWGAFYTRTTTIANAEGKESSLTLIAAQDPEELEACFTLRTRVGGRPIPMEQDSVILTEKTAETLDLSVGDSLWVQTPDGTRHELTLTGIAENYLFARLFIPAETLSGMLEGEVEWNTVYAATSCETEEERTALSEAVMDCNYVSSTTFAQQTASIFDNTIEGINYVVVVIIACAAALAAVVLYNLITVNLAERRKELATIKVLGFYDKEVYRYIFREIELLSLIGSLLGLVVGVPMYQFIIRTVEHEQMMFVRSIEPASFLFSVLLAMVFTLTVCFVMRRSIRRISMVESMKAPE